jgi:tripartite-type tricarboxylate transporter receptor subunit TctC
LSYANVLVVNKDQPFKTVPELVAYAKANPGKVAYGSAGMGASNHLSGELFAVRTGTTLNHVPYKGNAPAMTDVIGGQINMMFDIIGSARNYVASNRVRAVAVTSRERNASMPDVPSMRLRRGRLVRLVWPRQNARRFGGTLERSHPQSLGGR